jgi:Na+-translocating ferredoxin:NAD+ oxidoreductase RnfC subunit
MREGRRVPIKSLMRKLQLQDYDHPAPLRTTPLQPDRVTLRLKQSAGVPAKPVVAAGDRVTAGQLIAEPPANALGALLHAPFAARVESVTDTLITLTRSV